MIKAIITDIEGTTTSLSFVKEVLFPYARAHIAAYVMQHEGSATLKGPLHEVRQLMNKPQASLAACIDQLIAWIDQDAKITPLKVIQGLLWEEGYKKGDYQGHLYQDAHHFLTQWHQQGIPLYIYSSGSVYAQQLLFQHTVYGDLRPLFSGYFDTRIGSKKDTASYQAIAQQIAVPPADLVFLSDISAELIAAAGAGIRGILLARDAAADAVSPKDAAFPVARNFFEVQQLLF